MAQTLQNNVKGRDVVARYGGEEFAVILTGLALSDTVRIGNQIRNIIATQRLVRNRTGEEIAAITVSAGAACYRPGEAITALIGRLLRSRSER